MTPRTKSQVFIRTLEEMCDYERQRKKAQLRLQLKAHVKRFVEEFRSDLEGDRKHSELISHMRRTGHEAGRGFSDN